MNAYDFVHLTFLALGNEIRGKTKLQKVVYFLGLMTGKIDDLGYRPYYYGPYSDDVAAAVERLKALGFLDQTVAGIGAYDSRGFEVSRHDYRLNDAGTRVAQAKAAKDPDNWERIKNAATSLNALLSEDYMKLSIAAKTWFMLGNKNGPASMEELAALAPKFGWNVTPQQIQEAARLLESAKLVRING